MVVSSAEQRLAKRLRQLRRQSPMGRLTQAQVAKAFGVSPQQISSWESAKSPQMPSEERLKAYARLFSSARIDDGELTVVQGRSVSPEERQASEELEAELRALREAATVEAGDGRVTPSHVDGFWTFQDGRPVVIIGSDQPPEVLMPLPEADKHHPDYVETLHHADADAVVEVFGQVRADNPTSPVQILLPLTVRNNDHLVNHVVVVGGGAVNKYALWFAGEGGVEVRPARLDLPRDLDPSRWTKRRFIVPATLTSSAVTPDERGEDEEGRPVAIFHPRFRGSVPVPKRASSASAPSEAYERLPSLYEDIALITRQPNPLDPTATVTLIYGLFTRGTFGAVRSLTDPEVRESNEAFLRERFDGTKRYGVLFKVLCDRRLPVTKSPDLRQPGTVLTQWPR